MRGLTAAKFLLIKHMTLHRNMKLVIVTLLLVTVCQCNLSASDTLLKLSDILRSMNLEVGDIDSKVPDGFVYV